MPSSLHHLVTLLWYTHNIVIQERLSTSSLPVFHHLLNSIGWSLDDLSRSNAIHHSFIQATDHTSHQSHDGEQAETGENNLEEKGGGGGKSSDYHLGRADN